MRELFERAAIAADYLITGILDWTFDAYFWVIGIPGRIGDWKAARARRRHNGSGRVRFGVDRHGDPVYFDSGPELVWLDADPRMQGFPRNHQLAAYAAAVSGFEVQREGRTLRPNVVAEREGVPDREPVRRDGPDDPDFGWLHVDLADGDGRQQPKPYRAPDAPAADGNVYAAPHVNVYHVDARAMDPWIRVRPGESIAMWIARVAPNRSEAPTTMLRRLHAIVGAGLPVFRQNGALAVDTPFVFQNCLELQAFVTAAGSVGYRQLVLADEPDARQIRITPGMHEDGMPTHRSITLTYERINDLHAQLYPVEPEADLQALAREQGAQIAAAFGVPPHLLDQAPAVTEDGMADAESEQWTATMNSLRG